ncbi:MAG: hypothetical protein AAB354_03770 [candidate division KSB1 bacterium]
MISEYLEFRRLGRDLTKLIVETVTKHELESAAYSMRIMHKGVMVFDCEEESYGLMDRIVFDLRRGERNIVSDFYLSRSPKKFSADERRVLEAMMKARFSLFQVEEVDRQDSVVFLRDLINQTGPLKLIDINFSATCDIGSLLATRLVPFGDWCMTTGISYPFRARQVEELLRGLKRRVIGSAKKKFRIIPPEDFSCYFFLQHKAISDVEMRYEEVLPEK